MRVSVPALIDIYRLFTTHRRGANKTLLLKIFRLISPPPTISASVVWSLPSVASPRATPKTSAGQRDGERGGWWWQEGQLFHAEPLPVSTNTPPNSGQHWHLLNRSSLPTSAHTQTVGLNLGTSWGWSRRWRTEKRETLWGSHQLPFRPKFRVCL